MEDPKRKDVFSNPPPFLSPLARSEHFERDIQELEKEFERPDKNLGKKREGMEETAADLSKWQRQRSMAKFISKSIVGLSLLSYVIGILWVIILFPSHEYNERVYFSENALLPGQGVSQISEENLKPGNLTELLAALNSEERVLFLQKALKEMGLEAETQEFSHDGLNLTSGVDYVLQGRNVYGISRSMRSDRTEAIVISTPLETSTGKANIDGIALVLKLVQELRVFKHWSKDLIVVFSDKGLSGMLAWLEAYHEKRNPALKSSPLSLYAGAIQMGLNIEFEGTNGRYTNSEVKFVGINGHLPNLDYINLVNKILAKVFLESEKKALPWVTDFPLTGQYPVIDDVKNFAKNVASLFFLMVDQATGLPTAEHGLFHRFKIDALTIRGIPGVKGQGNEAYKWGKNFETILRSLSNTLEHLHQSFFFYLLPNPGRYISIGLYMPPFLAMIAGLLLNAVHLWWQAGKSPKEGELSMTHEGVTYVRVAEERPLSIGVAATTMAVSLLGSLLIYQIPAWVQYLSQYGTVNEVLMGTLIAASLIQVFTVNLFLPLAAPFEKKVANSAPDWMVLKALLLSFWVVSLCAIAVVNFSLAFFMALLAVPPALLIRPSKSPAVTAIQQFLLFASSPVCLLLIVSHFLELDPLAIFSQLLYGHQILSSWTFSFICFGYYPMSMASMFLINLSVE